MAEFGITTLQRVPPSTHHLLPSNSPAHGTQPYSLVSSQSTPTSSICVSQPFTLPDTYHPTQSPRHATQRSAVPKPSNAEPSRGRPRLMAPAPMVQTNTQTVPARRPRHKPAVAQGTPNNENTANSSHAGAQVPEIQQPHGLDETDPGIGTMLEAMQNVMAAQFKDLRQDLVNKMESGNNKTKTHHRVGFMQQQLSRIIANRWS